MVEARVHTKKAFGANVVQETEGIIEKVERSLAQSDVTSN